MTSSMEWRMAGNADGARERDKVYQYLRKETMIKDWNQLCPHSWATEVISIAMVMIFKHLTRKFWELSYWDIGEVLERDKGAGSNLTELGPQRGGWWKRTGSDVAYVPPLLLTDVNVITSLSSTFSICKVGLTIIPTWHGCYELRPKHKVGHKVSPQ